MSINAQANWDDIRFVVAVADHGSVAAAAKVLGVNHATVLRRIAAFEDQQGIKFFEKNRRGYQVLADRRNVLEAMRDAALAVGQVEHLIDTERPNLQGGVRVTSTDTLCHQILPTAVRRICDDLGIAIDVISDNAHLNLAQSQAHITVRPALALPPDLEGDAAAHFRFGTYGRSDSKDAWLGLSGPPARSTAGTWLRQKGQVSLVSADSFLTLANLAAEGLGRTLLPCFLGDRWPGLSRLSIPEDLTPTPIWVACHRDFSRSSRLRRVQAALINTLREHESVLMGEV